VNPELYILGSNSATPTRERHPTSQILKIGADKIMIDCGEGTQIQLIRYGIRHTGISHICISHLHGDHYFGLIGLLSSMSLAGRKEPLTLIAPPELQLILDIQIKYGGMQLCFDIIFKPTNPNAQELVLQTDTFEISTFPLKHRIHCTGFLIKETLKERALNMEEVIKYNVSVSEYKNIKKGSDYIQADGELIENKLISFDPKPIISYAFCSDTIFDESIVEYIKNVDLLYHEATYMQKHKDRATLYYHSTAEQAATIAKKASVKKLIIGHFSSRYDHLDPLLLEAQKIFENTELAIEGNKFVL